MNRRTGMYVATVLVISALKVAEAVERAIGDNCTNPIVVTIPGDLPFVDLDQTTDLREDDYNLTCLGAHDDGQDIIYRLNVLETTPVQFTFTPRSSTRAGIALDEHCPPDFGGANCILRVIDIFASRPFASELIVLAPGTYTLMIDCMESYWYITSFDFGIAALPHGTTCTWPLDVTSFPFSTASSTCDKRSFVTGPCSSSGQGLEAVLKWVVDDPRCVDVVVKGLTEGPIRATVTLHNTCPIAGSCLGASIGLTDRVALLDDQQLVPGTYYIVVEDAGVCTDFAIDIVPCDSGESCCVGFGACITASAERCAESGGTYLGQGPGCASVACPQATGNSCVDPLPIDLSQGSWSGSGTTCTRGADLTPLCAQHRAGEEVVYAFELTEPKRVSVQRTSASGPIGIAVSSACPQDADCTMSGNAQTATGVNLPPGTYHVIVDAPALPGCVDFALGVTATDPPPGDLCENAIPVPSLPFEYNVTAVPPTRYARDYPSDCNSPASFDFDIVLSYTPPSGMYVQIATCQGDYIYAVLSVHTENCRTPPVACNDSVCPPPTFNPMIDLVYLAGDTTHYIIVHYFVHYPPLPLTITERPEFGACCIPDGTCVVMSMDECASYGGLHSGSHTACEQVTCPPPTGETCDDPRVIMVGTTPYVEINSVCHRTNDFWTFSDEYCMYAWWTYGPDMFYRIDVPAAMFVTIDLTPLSLSDYPLLALNTNCPPYGPCIASGFSFDNPLHNVYLDAGSYYLTLENLDGISEDDGDFRLTVMPDGPSGACCFASGGCNRFTPARCAQYGGMYAGDGTNCYSPPCPREPGDTCENAFVLATLPASKLADTNGPFYDDYQPSCQGPIELFRDCVYAYTATRTGRIEIETCGASNHAAIIVFEDDCEGPEYACSPDGCISANAEPGRMRCLPVTQGHTYYIVVDAGVEGYPYPNGTSYHLRVWERTLTFASPCPADIIRTTDPLLCSARVAIPAPQYTGGCGNVTAQTRLDGVVISTPADVYLGPGVHQVRRTAADTGGQLLECVYTITVVDAITPTIDTCVPDYSVHAGPGGVAMTPDFTPYVLITENCPYELTQSIPAGTPLPPGEHPITFNVEDTSGNTASCSMVFSVVGPSCRGDADCDGVVTFFDIDAFVVGLQGESVYDSTYIDCHWLNNDINQDGAVDFFDIDPFIERLGSVCP